MEHQRDRDTIGAEVVGTAGDRAQGCIPQGSSEAGL